MPDKTLPTYDKNNIFARILRGELPCHKIFENENILAFMDVMPRSKGHALVIPKKPARTILDITPESLHAVMLGAQKLARASKTALHADGITIQQFNETAGGQAVFHFHVHVIPRWNDVPLLSHADIMAPSDELIELSLKIQKCLETEM